MWLFYLKKNFCDGWDNMFSLLAINAVFLIPIAGISSLLITALAARMEMLFFAFLFCLSSVLFIEALSFAPYAAKAADFCGWSIKDCLKGVWRKIPEGFLLGGIVTLLAIIMRVCIPFYFMRKSFILAAVGVLFVWLCVFFLLSLQYYAAVAALLPGTFKKRLKKCFILFFDNTAFSVFLAVYCLFLSAVSVVFFGLLPAASGVTLARVNALRLRLYKYDYLEAHPEYASGRERKIIPWTALLKDDKEALGPRTLKSFFFPWKE